MLPSHEIHCLFPSLPIYSSCFGHNILPKVGSGRAEATFLYYPLLLTRKHEIWTSSPHNPESHCHVSRGSSSQSTLWDDVYKNLQTFECLLIPMEFLRRTYFWKDGWWVDTSSARCSQSDPRDEVKEQLDGVAPTSDNLVNKPLWKPSGIVFD